MGSAMTDNQLILVESGELDHYDPHRGLKNVAVAEAAENHYRRAKDATQLFKAIEAKLNEQRKFVRWWDGLGEKRGSGPTKRRNGPVTSLPISGRDGMPDRMVIKRWRAATSAKRYERTLEEAKEQCRLICERGKRWGTGDDEWFTPSEYVEIARSVLDEIDLDPASHDVAQSVVRAGRFFTKADDGLKQEWHGRVWLNPPYTQPLITQFVDKMVEERRAGRVSAAIMLTHNYTDTKWFRTALSVADAIGFTSGRVRFYAPDGRVAESAQGQAFFYFGNETARFAEAFKDVFAGVLFSRERSNNWRLCDDEAPPH